MRIDDLVAAGANDVLFYQALGPQRNLCISSERGVEMASVLHEEDVDLLDQLSSGAAIALDLSRQRPTAVVDHDTRGTCCRTFRMD